MYSITVKGPINKGFCASVSLTSYFASTLVPFDDTVQRARLYEGQTMLLFDAIY